MRFLLLAAVLTLAACASSPPPAPTPVVAAPAAPASAAAPPANILSSAGRPNAPTTDAVLRALGPADVTRHDGAGTALTYRLDHCALLLLFVADTRNVQRLAEADASARHTGEAAPALDACIAEAQARTRQH